MEITQSEYEKKRHIFELCRWINEKLVEMENEPNFNEIYFERKGQNVKKLIEEAIPVSYLGLHFCKLRREIFVTCLVGNQPYDATMELVDPFRQESIKIEVCITENDASTLRRHALSRNGSVYFTGDIRREGRKIISEVEMVDLDSENNKVVELAYERFRSKVEHGYDLHTVILVHVNFYRPLPHRYRLQLLERVRVFLRENKPALHGIYFCYQANLEVDGLNNDLMDLEYPISLPISRAP